MSRLGEFLSLPGQERRWLLQSIVLLPIAAAWLRCVGFTRLYRTLAALRGGSGQAACDERTWRDIRAADRMVGIASRHTLGRRRCLAETLVLWWLVRDLGGAIQFRIGVRKEGADLRAHAWLEIDGHPVNAPSGIHDEYAAFDGLIASRSASTAARTSGRTRKSRG